MRTIMGARVVSSGPHLVRLKLTQSNPSSRRKSSSPSEAMVVRADDGSYVCMVDGCCWRRKGAARQTPYRHVELKHPGLRANIVRRPRQVLTSEEKALSREQAIKRHKARKKRGGVSH